MRRVTAIVAAAAAVAAGLLANSTSATSADRNDPLDAVLVGGNEVPGPGDSDGFGLAKVFIDEPGVVCWKIRVQDVDRPLTAAHIHAGPAGVSGPVVVPLSPIKTGCVDVKKRLGRSISEHPSQYYVNVHNEEFPAGAVRGQLLR